MRRVVVAVLMLGGLLGLSGCTSAGSCNDFVSLPKPQDRYDAAPIVVVARVAPTDRTVEPNAVYAVYRARIERVVKGRLAATAIDLYAPADQCFTDGQRATYLEKDPLAKIGRSVLYIHWDSRVHAYSLVTTEALDPLPASAPLPFSTATPLPTPS